MVRFSAPFRFDPRRYGGYSQAELEEAGAFRVYADPANMLEHIEDVGLD
jgi:hypothetical protein